MSDHPAAVTILPSAKKTVHLSRTLPAVLIGDRINPSGRRAFAAALRAGDFSMVRREASAQVAAGATVLDVNAGGVGNEVSLLPQVVRAVMSAVDVPLCFDSANPKALAAALAVYRGRALLNSVNGMTASLAAVLPLAAEHGAAVVGLCLDEGGIPATSDDTLRIAERILRRAVRAGLSPADVIFDPLALSLKTHPNRVPQTLRTIALLAETFGANVTIGVRNVSFGMENRAAIERNFLAQALDAGATCPLADPLSTGISVLRAVNQLPGRNIERKRNQS